jgi:hypothetical protein
MTISLEYGVESIIITLCAINNFWSKTLTYFALYFDNISERSCSYQLLASKAILCFSNM